jgi:dipeptidyl aminopeptidase/acylaminoacyl peptidase
MTAPRRTVLNELNGPPTMSVDGRYAAWLSCSDGAAQLVIYDVARQRERARLSTGAARCQGFTWSSLPGIGLALADPAGDERWTLFRVDVERDEWMPLGGWSDAQTTVAGLSPQRPEHVHVTVNARDPRHHDHHLISLRTGASDLLLENRGYAAVYCDQTFRPRIVETVGADGSRDLWHGIPSRGQAFLHVSHEHALSVSFRGFTPDGTTAFLDLPDGPDAMRLASLRVEDGQPAGEPTTHYSVRRGEIGRVLFSAAGAPAIVHVEGTKPHCVPLGRDVLATVRALRRRLRHEPEVLERRAGGRLWLVARHSPDVDAHYFLYEPRSDRLTRLADARPHRCRARIRPAVADVPLRDRERAITYIMRPAEAAAHDPPPAALLVHGGPWRRSRWRYDERRASLAEQGICVIEPNFRGSTGFGSAWVAAGDRQWGEAMQDDLEDAIDWAVDRGLADPTRLALVGGSYGGYAVLQLAATSTRKFGCVVATAPLTDLVRFVEQPPAFWESALPALLRRVGDPSDREECHRLERLSPVNNGHRISCPVLLVHGTNDSRVPVEMSTRMLISLAAAGADGTLALLPGEGHEIVGSANRRAVDALVEAFLARHLDLAGIAPTGDADSTMRVFTTPSRTPTGDQHGTAFQTV